MANAFKNVTFQGGAVAADFVSSIGTATGSTSQITLIGMTIANISSPAEVISVGVKITDNAGTPVLTWLVKDAPIPVGGSLVVCGGDQKIVLAYNSASTSGDQLQVVSNKANSIDVVMSYLEIT